MGHGRLYRFTCQSCDGEYIAVGAETDEQAIAMAQNNGWSGEDDRWSCPDCAGDEADEKHQERRWHAA